MTNILFIHLHLLIIVDKLVFGTNSICYQRPKAGYET
jgi:hypothetical protein